MSAKTKIVVLHMKEVVYTAIFAGLGILLTVLLLFMFVPDDKSDDSTETMNYVAGVYSSSIMCGSHAVDVQVIVDETKIDSISLVNLDETVTTMYPLMEPAMETIKNQVLKNQSTEGITYNSDQQYTALMLLNAIEQALSKAKVTETTNKTTH